MAKNAKYLTNNSRSLSSLLIKQLIPLAERMREPINYLAGLSVAGLAIPDNIVIFRSHADKLRRLAPIRHIYQYIIIVNLRGNGCVVVDDRVLHLPAAHSLLLSPGEKFYYTNITDFNLCWLYVTFRISKPEPLFALRYRVLPLSKRGLTVLQNMMKDYLNPDRSTPAMAGCIAFQLWLLLQELIQTVIMMPARPTSKSNHELIYTIQHYLHAHLCDSIRISDIARHVHMSSSKLQRLFAKTMEMNLGTYIRTARINYAAELMLSSDMTLSEIADHCGFIDIYTFSRAFKKALGMPPRKYRDYVRCHEDAKNKSENKIIRSNSINLPIGKYWGSV